MIPSMFIISIWNDCIVLPFRQKMNIMVFFKKLWVWSRCVGWLMYVESIGFMRQLSLDIMIISVLKHYCEVDDYLLVYCIRNISSVPRDFIIIIVFIIKSIWVYQKFVECTCAYTTPRQIEKTQNSYIYNVVLCLSFLQSVTIHILITYISIYVFSLTLKPNIFSLYLSWNLLCVVT